MSVYLTLYPISRSDLSGKDICLDTKSRLCLDQDYNILSQFEGMEGYFPEYPKPIIPTHKLCPEIGVEIGGNILLQCKNGAPLTFAFAQAILNLQISEEDRQQQHQTMATLAYLEKLPTNTSVILIWD